MVSQHATVLGIRKYVQTNTLFNIVVQNSLEQSRGSGHADFDGCAELWWDSLDAHLEARRTAEGLKALRELIEDEHRFIDLSRSLLWYGEERAIYRLPII
ncbi:EthD domain-containing protein [Klebsiella quasivariicola]|nr:EthD domain-containing protein [Klebsiella quasivariicola]